MEYDEEKTYELFKQYKEGNIEARNEIILLNIKLVPFVISRMKLSLIEYDDAIQVGYLGLLKACEYFDIDKGYKFSTFATIIIRNEIKQNIRKTYNQIKHRQIKDNEYLLENIQEDIKDYSDEIVLKRVKELIADLDDRDAYVLNHFFSDEEFLSQTELSKKCNISQSYVSRIIKRNLIKISYILINEGLLEENSANMILQRSKKN